MLQWGCLVLMISQRCRTGLFFASGKERWWRRVPKRFCFGFESRQDPLSVAKLLIYSELVTLGKLFMIIEFLFWIQSLFYIPIQIHAQL